MIKIGLSSKYNFIMSGIKRFEDLEVWRAAQSLCIRIGNITSRGPLSKDYPNKGSN